MEDVLDQIKEREKIIFGVKYDTNLFGLKILLQEKSKDLISILPKQLQKKSLVMKQRLNLKK